ncbi:hypothetical protein FB565_006168 [Actinoplanes lutulentus]|uniref:Uncharacterized protein n=1 Tax=Actinoplanes lutulentus TaxID=1287878 RepID=A0A327YVK7_9ACTN|nr:DUF6334 family protein [Actinoplanes lutulentus]MBB2940476.1 hypothetical protein [Actinoplanes lutulentus]MBB2946400.1 hypothetical protein [Actinoplanes lutulentus]RAK24623.1 hypothetical protein B0I29_1421 [Actinoplanes lutulentus]
MTDLAEIVHVTFSEDPSWLVAVQLRFKEGFLQVEVSPDDDTVEVSFDALHRPALRHWASESVSISMNERYENLLGSDSAWWWLLRNQHQYEDGFQIELGPASSTTTFQYLAIASRLYLRHVAEANQSTAEPRPSSITDDQVSPKSAERAPM